MSLDLSPTDAHVKGGRPTGQSVGSEAVSASILCCRARNLESVPPHSFQGFHAAGGEGDKEEEEEGEDKAEMHFFH